MALYNGFIFFVFPSSPPLLPMSYCSLGPYVVFSAKTEATEHESFQLTFPRLKCFHIAYGIMFYPFQKGNVLLGITTLLFISFSVFEPLHTTDIAVSYNILLHVFLLTLIAVVIFSLLLSSFPFSYFLP